MLKDLTMNIAIIVSFLFLVGQVTIYIHKRNKYQLQLNSINKQLIAGVLLGLLGIVLMIFSIRVNSAVIVDLRHISTVIAAVFFGAPAAIVSAILIGFSRLILFGGLTEVSLNAMIGMFSIGIVCALSTRLPFKRSMKFLVMNALGILLVYITLYVNLGLVSNDTQTLYKVYSIHWLISLIGGLIAFYVFNYMYRSNQASFELEEINSRLETLVKNLNSGILVESPDRKIELINDKFYEIFELTDKEIAVGLNRRKLDEGNDFHNHELSGDRVNEIISDKVLVTNEELALKNGRIVERDYIPILSKNGDFLGHLWNYQDITNRKQREQELKLNQEMLQNLTKQYELVVNTVKEVIYQTDKFANWQFLNNRWTEVTGYPVTDRIGTSIYDIYHPDDRNLIRLTREELLSTSVKESATVEVRIITKHKIVKWIEIQANLLVNEDGEVRGTAGTIRDITLQREIEKKLEISNEWYKSLFENNQSATFALNELGHFTQLNLSTGKVTGYTVDELTGSSILPLISKDCLEHTRIQFNLALSGKSAMFETKLIKKNGEVADVTVSVAPIIVNSKIEGIIGVAHDITNQKKSERELRESEQRYKSLIELYPEGIYVQNQDRLLFINDQILELLKIEDKETALLRPFMDYIHPEDRERVAYSITLIFQNKVPLPVTYETRFIKADRQPINVELGVSLIYYDGSPAIMGVVRDITTRKEAERKLKEANAILQQLSSVDGLTGIPNRRSYDITLEKEWNRAIRSGNTISLIMLDIDCFKAFNDTYGHRVGDDCLKKVATTLKLGVNRASDFLARYGGEEFSVILPSTEEEGAKLVAETLLKSIGSLQIPNKNSTVLPIVTISLGVATMKPKKGKTYTELIEMADHALYSAKSNGRNQVRIFENNFINN